MKADNVVARVRAYRDQQGWSNNQLATKAKLAESTVRNIDHPDWNCRLSTLRALEALVPDDFTHPSYQTTMPRLGE